MARGIGIGDLVAVTATVRRRVTEERVTYNFPHSIIDHSKVKRGQQIELTGKVTHIDGDKVTISLRPLVTVDAEHVRLVEGYVAPKRKTPLVDKPT